MHIVLKIYGFPSNLHVIDRAAGISWISFVICTMPRGVNKHESKVYWHFNSLNKYFLNLQ